MRIVFMGTAEFAVPSLRRCVTEHEVVAVVTQPDRPGSRGTPAPRPIRDVAAEAGIEVLTPARIREQGAVDAILATAPDGVVVAAYGQILPEPLLARPRFGAINVHASLLPRWRGAAPIAHAILAGDDETGVSIMQMDKGLDTGPVYARRSVAIPPDATTPALTALLAELGADVLIDVLSAIESGEARATPQPEEGATYAPRLRREDGELEWSECSAADIDRHVRALQPWPGVTLPLNGSRVRVLAGVPVTLPARDAATAPGSVLRQDGESVLVAAREDAYRVDSVQPPGARTMTPAAFLRGRRER
jgi:methionyl-tRNA formyltransferase